MRRGQYGVSNGVVAPWEIKELLFNLIDKNRVREAHEKLEEMNKRIRDELKLYEEGVGNKPCLIEKPEEWYMYNFGKAEYKAAIIEYLMKIIHVENEK